MSDLPISRFTFAAQKIILGVTKPARERRETQADSIDLLASMAESKTVYGEALKQCGADYGHVLIQGRWFKDFGGNDFQVNQGNLFESFTSDGRNAIVEALVNAEGQNLPKVTEQELFDALVFNERRQSRKALNNLEVSPKLLSLALKVADSNKTKTLQEIPQEVCAMSV